MLAISLLVTTKAVCQQSIRTPEQSEFRTFRTNTEGTSLINLGPFHGEATLDVGYEYNDNAQVTNQSTLSLSEIFEALHLDMGWTLSPLNRLDLKLDGRLEENFYSNGSNQLNLDISPGSQLQLQATVGDVILRAFEQFAIIQDPVSDPTATNQTNLNRLTNTIGIAAIKPLYHAAIGLEFDYIYSDSFSGSSADTGTSVNRNSLRLASTFGLDISPELSYGLEASATDNAGSGNEDIKSLSFGPYLRGHLTRLLDVDLGAGITLTDSSLSGSAPYYVSLTIRHQVFRTFQYVIGFSHDLDFSSGLSLSQNNNFFLSAQWQLLRIWTISAGPFVNFGHVLTGFSPGNYTQYGVSIQSRFKLGKRISTGIGYRFTHREGNGTTTGTGGTNGNYAQNLLTLDLTYAF
jgi:hypothetical protein